MIMQYFPIFIKIEDILFMVMEYCFYIILTYLGVAWAPTLSGEKPWKTLILELYLYATKISFAYKC